MLSDIRKYSKPRQLKYELLKPHGFKNGVPSYKSYGYIEGIITDNINWNMHKVDELTIEISKFVQNGMGGKDINVHWNLVKPNYVIEVSNNISEDRQRFLIGETAITSKEFTTKSITALSLESELRNKSLRNLRSVGTTTSTIDVLESRTLETILNGNENVRGILDEYTYGTWALAHIDASVATRKRTYEYSEGSVLGFFNAMCTSFNCIFIYDTINRTISIYDLVVYPACPRCGQKETLYYRQSHVYCGNPDFNGEKCGWGTTVYGKDSGLYITHKNYIQQFIEEEDISQLCTRLYVYGKDGLEIRGADANIANSSYLQNFDHFMNDDHMTHELQQALKSYDEYIFTITSDSGKSISELNAEKVALYNERKEKVVGSSSLDDYYSFLELFKADIDTAMKSGKDYGEIIDDLNNLAFDYTPNESWGLTLLQELSDVYQTRIDAITELAENSSNINANLLLSNEWSKGSEIKFGYEGTTITLSSSQGTVAIPTAHQADNPLRVYLNGTIMIEGRDYEVKGTTIKNLGLNLYKSKSTVDSLIKTLKSEIAVIDKNIITIDQQISFLSDRLDMDSYILALENGENLLKELNLYVKTIIYTNNDIGVDNINEDIGTSAYKQAVEDLYIDGTYELYRRMRPSVEFIVRLVDFFKLVECQHDWHRLSIGDIIHIRHPDSTKEEQLVRVTGIKYSSQETDIDIQISNSDGFFSVDQLTRDIYKGFTMASRAVSLNKDNWNNAKANAVDQILNDEFTQALITVRAGQNQSVVVDNKGITISSTLAPLSQVRMMNGLITFTDDGWQTSKTAIRNGYVVAENIIGEIIIGKNLTITATKEDGSTLTFKVDGSGVLINNGSLRIVDDSNEGNGVIIKTRSDKTDDDDTFGLIIVKNNKTFRVVMNADDGIYFQKGDGNGNWTDKVLKIGTDGSLTADGTIIARDLKNLNGDSVWTNLGKVAPEYLELKGLTIKNNLGQTTFSIDSNGNFKFQGVMEHIKSGMQLYLSDNADSSKADFIIKQKNSIDGYAALELVNCGNQRGDNSDLTLYLGDDKVYSGNDGLHNGGGHPLKDIISNINTNISDIQYDLYNSNSDYRLSSLESRIYYLEERLDDAGL